jgi:hypothetical protein
MKEWVEMSWFESLTMTFLLKLLGKLQIRITFLLEVLGKLYCH